MRRGPFWDVVEGRAPAPPIAELLGFRLRQVDPQAMTIEVEFTATAAFLNPAGHVQGGILAAMLDDTMGPALVASLDADEWAPTTDLHVQFLLPARPGRLTGRGRVVRRGRGTAFLAGELSDDSGHVVATGIATATVRGPGRGVG
jgi:uncharacterized protein (TIGR00369 family)